LLAIYLSSLRSHRRYRSFAGLWKRIRLGQTQLLPCLNPFPTNGLPGGLEHRLTGKFVAAMIYELQDNVKIDSLSIQDEPEGRL
jgi:hypothetical protein